MTQFAVTSTVVEWTDITPPPVDPPAEREVEYSDDKFPLVVVIVFAVFTGIFVIIGCILDRKGALLLFDNEIDPKKRIFFDLRDVPTREANYPMTDPASKAEPVVLPMDNQRRPPRAHH